MSIIYTFTKEYLADPSTTSLFTLTCTLPSNYIIDIMGTSNDLFNAMAHSVHTTYVISWDGVTFTIIPMGASPAQYGWSSAGNVTFFNFSPVIGASNGTIGLQITLIMSDVTVPPTLDL